MSLDATRLIGAPPPPDPDRALGLEALGMTKRFGEFAALDDVSLKVPAGTFHALLGENGAGKSTLVKCIMGYYRADEGSVMIADREHAIEHPRAAHALGLGMVYQHFTSVPAMTVTENFVLARPVLPAIIDWRKEKAGARSLSRRACRSGCRSTPRCRRSRRASGRSARSSSSSICSAASWCSTSRPRCSRPARPTRCSACCAAMVARNELTILMITHKFREVMAFADEVTILRRGRLSGSGRVADLTPDAMAAMMIGAQELTAAPARSANFGAPRLELDRLSALDDAGQPAVNDVSLGVRSGEIVGVAGVSGNGQRQMIEVLAGQRDASGGEVRIAGKVYHATREEMRDLKLSCLPEEPLKNACVARMSVAENLAFRDFDRAPFAAGGWWLQGGKIRQQADRKIAEYKIKTQSPGIADRRSFRRQRPARGAGAGTGRRGRAC